jgi:hypothetical protein
VCCTTSISGCTPYPKPGIVTAMVLGEEPSQLHKGIAAL